MYEGEVRRTPDAHTRSDNLDVYVAELSQCITNLDHHVMRLEKEVANLSARLEDAEDTLLDED